MVGIKEFNFKGDKNMSENAYKQAGVDVEAGIRISKTNQGRR